jgi:hypothetical protein
VSVKVCTEANAYTDIGAVRIVYAANLAFGSMHFNIAFSFLLYGSERSVENPVFIRLSIQTFFSCYYNTWGTR